MVVSTIAENRSNETGFATNKVAHSAMLCGHNSVLAEFAIIITLESVFQFL